MSAVQSPTEVQRPAGTSAKPLPLPSVFAFIGSGSLLVLELVAGRILAPVVGVSLYTWTSVIGVVLAGLSLGNWLGGKIADRWPRRSTLSLLFLLGGLATALILVFADNLESVDAPRGWPTTLEVVWLTTVVFFVPSVLLGTPLPVIVKLALRSLETTGRVVGRIQAAGSIGSIVGAFLTGFVLISVLGTRTIIAGVAVTLVLLAILSSPLVPSLPGLPASMRRRTGRLSAGIRDRVKPILARLSPARLGWTGGEGADPSAPPRPLPIPPAFAFVGSGCLLVLEIVAGRMLAPVVGVSLYTWTSVIGVVLAGLSIGNWLGGKIADRWPGRGMLSLLYLLAALSTSLILLLARDLQGISEGVADWSPQLHVLWLTAMLFLLPSIMLGTPTPMLVKLTLASLGETGRVVGRIQAWATMGTIVGVFASGFFLISAFGTNGVVIGVAAVLLGLAFFSHPLSLSPRAFAEAAGRRPQLAIVLGLIVVTTVAFMTTSKDACQRESDYFCIDVVTNPDGIREMELDLLVHGRFDPNQPDRLVYEYEQLYAEVARNAFKRDDELETFTMGGGAYSFPRYLDKFYERSHNLVAEIDPEVTDTARDDFGLTDSPDIDIIHDDARIVLRDRPADERYDLVLADAFNDITVPYHLTTREFNDMIARHLTPRGLFLANVIDGKCYDFLRSYAKTLKLSFRNVGILTVPGQPISGERATVVVVSTNGELPRLRNLYPYDSLLSFIERGEDLSLMDALTPFREEKARKPVTLEDDFVPVDQLLAPVFGESLKEVGAATETATPLRCPASGTS
jgi:predicted membrane-bound spermidine synthase